MNRRKQKKLPEMAGIGRSLGHKLCLDHSIKELTFICKTCGIPICNICVTSTHKKHDFANIVNYADLKLDELQGFKTDAITRQIPEIEQAVEFADDEFYEVVQLIQRNIKTSRDHGECLRELIAEHMSRTETEYNNMLTRYRNDQHRYKAQSQDAINILEQLIKESEDAARSKSNILVVDVAMHIALRKPSVFKYQKPIVKSFVQGTEQEKHTQEAFGCIQQNGAGDSKDSASNREHHGYATKKKSKKQQPSTIRYRYLMPEVKQVGTFPASPKAMVRSTDGTLYICYNESSHLTKVTEPGFSIEVECDVRILDISVHPTTDQMYCIPFSGRNVRLLNCQTGKSRKRFDIQENPICLVVTKDSHVIVGDSNNPLLHVYNTIGNKLQTLKCEGNPKQVAVCRYSGIVGIAFGYSKGCSVLDNKYQKLYTTILPCDCVDFDGHGNMLLGDYHNKCVYIRNAETGEHIGTITSDKIPGNITFLVTHNIGELAVSTSTPHQLLTIKYLQ